MDEKFTPLENLNNSSSDDSQVVNNILSTYNNMQHGNELPSSPDMQHLENKFENRDLNNDLYTRNSDNTPYEKDYVKQKKRIEQYTKSNPRNNRHSRDEDEDEDYEDEDEGDYEEFEIQNVPLWKQIVNNVKIPLFIFIFIMICLNKHTQKLLLNNVVFFADKYNDLNMIGFSLLAVLASVLAYIFIKIVHV